MNARKMRCIAFTLMSKETSQSCSEQVENAALMHVTGAVEKNIGRAEFLEHGFRQRLDFRGAAHIEREHLGFLQALEFAGVEIGRDHIGAFGDTRLRDRAPDALAGRGHQRKFSF